MIGTIEQAILDRIQAFSAAGHLGYAIRTVRSYGGELESAEALAAAAAQMPAVLTLYAGEDTPEDRTGALHCSPRYSVYVCHASRRNNAAARLTATAAEVGSYQVLADVRALLWQQTLGLEITPLQIGAVDSVLQQDGISVYRMTITTEYDVSPSLISPATLADLDLIHVGWDIPSHGNVTRVLPASPADAEDLITLPGVSL